MWWEAKGEILATAGTRVDQALAEKLAKYPGIETLTVKPYVTTETTYMSADTEDKFTIAQANAKMG